MPWLLLIGLVCGVAIEVRHFWLLKISYVDLTEWKSSNGYGFAGLTRIRTHSYKDVNRARGANTPWRRLHDLPKIRA